MEPKLLTANRFVDMETGVSYRYVYSQTEYFRPHYHDYCEVFLVLSGLARHLVGGSEHPLQPRQLVFIRPSDIHDYISESGGYSMLNITFTRQTLQQVFSFLGDGIPGYALLHAPEPPQVLLTQQDFDRISSRMTAIRAIPEGDVSARKMALRVLLVDLFSRYFSGFAGDLEAAPQWLEAACDRLRRSGGTQFFCQHGNVCFIVLPHKRKTPSPTGGQSACAARSEPAADDTRDSIRYRQGRCFPSARPASIGQ
jgi:AraC family cel operon transcriptional repressor